MYLKSLTDRAYALIDVETNGLSPTRGQVIEIGILRIEQGKVVDSFQSLVQPSRPVPHYISSLTGIDEEDLQQAPIFEDIALRVRELLSGAVFVAHNARFDYGFIKNEFARLGIPFSAKTLCTVKLSRTLFPYEREHHLDSLIERHGLSCKNRHRAYDDAEVLWQFFTALEQGLPEGHLTSAIASVLGTHALPAGLDPATIAALPHAPGVYLFYNDDGDLLYVGKSIDIKTRVKSHFAGDYESAKERALCAETRSIEYRETTGELSALLLEAKLIKDLEPVYNRALRKRKRLAVVTSVITPEGYRAAELSYRDELDPEREDILGVFRTISQGKAYMKEAVREHKLCAKLCGVEKGVGACFGSQIGTCEGVCRKETRSAGFACAAYNRRFLTAFTDRRIRSWPYAGPILVKEEPDEEEGVAYLLMTWRIVKKFTYTSDGTYSEEPLEEIAFDYDTYKILSRFLLSQKPARIKSVSESSLSYDEEPVIV